MSNSRDLLGRAQRAMPGGVSSPVRAFGAVQGPQIFLARGEGAHVVDVDGNRYVDLVGSWGPLILGHAHPAVVEAVTRAVRDGLTFGATCRNEVELAERVLRRFPFAERVRFVNSGTEAVMSAVRLARGVTGRSRIVKFEGCYHGHVDNLLVKGGSGLATFGTPSSAGVPAEFTALTDVLPLDDVEAFTEHMRAHGDAIACVIIEPMPANAGLLLQRPEFLVALREQCTARGALLIFDEVISGFRVAPGGMTELSGLTPDLVTAGKIVGGGMPVGCYLGPAASMDQVAPLGGVYQAGTLSGNPVGMAAGVATLDVLDAPDSYAQLEARGARLQAGLLDALHATGTAGSVARVGSVLWMSLQDGDTPRTYPDIRAESAALYGPLHREVLRRGTWMAPSSYEVAFVSTAHTDADVDAAVSAVREGLAACEATV